MNHKMATVERRPSSSAVTVAAFSALLLALYSAFSVATFWGALGGLAGGFGAWISVWVLRQRPGRAIRAVAVVALVVNLLALALATVIITLVVLGEI
jgi:hypothetical protein